MNKTDDQLAQQVEEQRKQREAMYGTGNPDPTAPATEPPATEGTEGAETPEGQPSEGGDNASFSDFAQQFENTAGDGGSESVDDELKRLREENANLRNKDKSAAGRLRKATEEDDAEKRGLREENERLRKRNEELETQGKTGADKYLTDEERQALDEPVRRAIGRTAEGIAKEEISKVGARLDEQDAILAEIVERDKASAKIRFQSELETAVPDIGTLTTKNPKFVAFMKEREPITGKTYHELSVAALKANDSRTTIEIISRYKQSIGEPPHRDPNVLAQQRPGSFKAAKQPPNRAGERTYTVQEYYAVENQLLADPALVKDAAFSALLGEVRKARDEGRITR